MLTTRLTELLDLTAPLVLAPMGRWANPELVAAVSAAGGLGALCAWPTMGIDERYVRKTVAAIRATTDRPFAAGFATHHLPDCRSSFEAVLELQVPVVLLSFDDPTPWIRPIHDAGAKVICQVQTLAAACQAADAGADVLAVQGSEAGGHTGHCNLLPFLVQVLDRFPELPTIAAGGISNGRSLAAVLAAGADGAWVGTAFLATNEATYQPDLAKAIVASDGTDTIRSTALDVVFGAAAPGREPWPDGIALRSRRNEVTDQWHGREAELEANGAVLDEYIRRLKTWDPEVFPFFFGEGAGAIEEVRPAAEVVRSLQADALAYLRRWCEA